MTAGLPVVVVGAGVVGAAIAFRLAKAGARVTVVDGHGVAAGATGRSFGWINASFFLSEAHYRLRLEGIAAHRRLAAELPGTGHLWPGCLWWEEEGEGLDRLRDGLTTLGYPVRVLSGAEIAALEPGLARPPGRALLFPSEGAVDAATLARRLLSVAAEQGARLLTGAGVAGVATEAGKVSGVITAEGHVLGASRVVFAAGSGTPALLAPLGVALPMLARPGLMLGTKPAPSLVRHILATPAGDIRQGPDGRILMPASASHQGDDAEALGAAPDALAEAAVLRLRTLIPAAPDWETATLAMRPVPGDGLPVIGPAGPDGLYLAVMHSGVTLAPLVGELASRELLSGVEAELLATFRPGRFAG